jgi:two-component system sensor histidine kinase MtrB
LRTPLTTIRMAGEVLHASREDFTVPVARSAELLYEELDRFEALLTELLEISRYDAGAADLELDQVDLRGVVRQVVGSLTALSAHAGSEVRLVLPERPVTIEMDQRRVSRILRNLVANALDHGEGRPIDISLTEATEAVAVTVRDHGVGLTPEQAALVFDRFWRGDPARNRTTGGTGLGLAIASEDARLHGGHLQVAGESGRGAVFRLTLPRALGRTIPRPATLELLNSPEPVTPSVTEPKPKPRGDSATSAQSLPSEGSVPSAASVAQESDPDSRPPADSVAAATSSRSKETP